MSNPVVLCFTSGSAVVSLWLQSPHVPLPSVARGDGEPVLQGEAASLDQQQPTVAHSGGAGPREAAVQPPICLHIRRRRLFWGMLHRKDWELAAGLWVREQTSAERWVCAQTHQLRRWPESWCWCFCVKRWRHLTWSWRPSSWTTSAVTELGPQHDLQLPVLLHL